MVKEIGSGSYGLVILATQRLSNLFVAIKKIPDVFKSQRDAARILREITILKQLPPHPNIVTLCDVLEPSNDPQNFESIFIVMRHMKSDLQRQIASASPLQENHVQFIMYQLLSAVAFLHSAGVAHRDIKPANILLNSNCKINLCDFGLSRVIKTGANRNSLTSKLNKMLIDDYITPTQHSDKSTESTELELEMGMM